MKPWVYAIRPENFEDQVVSEKVPFLLLCMPRNNQFFDQLKIIEDIGEVYQKELKVGVFAEESIDLFKKRFHIIGTPTFLILSEGRELNRFLGVIDQKTLTDLISQFFTSGSMAGSKA